MHPFYQAKNTTKAELFKQNPSGFCLMSSTSSPGRQGLAGRVCEVSIDTAARLITEGTHKLASDTEAAEFRNAQAMARARNAPAMTLDAAREAFKATMTERAASPKGHGEGVLEC